MNLPATVTESIPMWVWIGTAITAVVMSFVGVVLYRRH